MTSYWPTEDGWPYHDDAREEVDLAAIVDDDVLSLSMEKHLLDDLNAVERQVIEAHYGLHGAAPRSMKELRSELGMNRADLRSALGSGLAKLRTHLT
jgi:DNA-directed RNA polymerase sigma subunit (sigma70/sigma32)